MKVVMLTAIMIFALFEPSSVLLSQGRQVYGLPGMAKEQQTLFRVRLENLVNLTKEGRWNEVYELLSTRARAGRDKKQFVAEKETTGKEGYIVVSFTPTSAEHLDRSIWGSDVWIISGCGQYKKDGKLLELEAVIEAFPESNEWFFSEVMLKTQLDSAPQKCNFKAKGSRRLG